MLKLVNFSPTTDHSPVILHIALQAAPASGTVSKKHISKV